MSTPAINGIIKSIDRVLLNELNHIIYPSEDVKSLRAKQPDPYIKFQLIATNIEFLWACCDNYAFDGHDYPRDKSDESLSEKRFRKALRKLFRKEYWPYAKKDSQYYLYKQFRCGMVHRLCSGPTIVLTTRKEAEKAGLKHLGKLEGKLVLVLEEFYDDFRKAVGELRKRFEKGLTKKKSDDAFWRIEQIEDAAHVTIEDGDIPAVTGSAEANVVKLSEEGDGDEEKGNSDEIDEGFRFIRI